MRDLSAWLGRLPQDLRSQGFPEDVMPAAEFCRVELGLYFLATHFPGEPAGVLQPVLSGYVRVGEDLDAVIRRVRHRMGDVARRGYWRKLLNQYMRIPDAIRALRPHRLTRPAASATRRVFAARPSSVCADRDDTYAAALADPLAYRAEHPPAEAGKRYAFTAAGATEYVRFPERAARRRAGAADVDPPRPGFANGGPSRSRRISARPRNGSMSSLPGVRISPTGTGGSVLMTCGSAWLMRPAAAWRTGLRNSRSTAPITSSG